MTQPRAGAQPEGSRSRFPRPARIRSGQEIRGLLRKGQRHRIGPLEVFVDTSPGALPRYGTVVPLYGRKVVRRNLLRRRLREVGRTEVLPRLRAAGRPLDVLVRTRPQAYSASYAELRSELISLTERLCSDVSSSD